MTIDNKKATQRTVSSTRTKTSASTKGTGTAQAGETKQSAETTKVAASTKTQQTTATSKATDGFEMGGKGFAGLDELWARKDFAGVIDAVKVALAPLESTDYAGINGQALIAASKSLYVLEERVKATVNQLSGASDMPLKLDALRLLQSIAATETAVFRAAVVLQDAAETHPVSAWVVAKDTHKSAHKWSPDEHRAYVAQKTVEFYLKGGTIEQIGQIGPDFLKSLPSGSLCEYVVDAYDVARAATVVEGRPSPGHTVLADGNDALTAGTFELHKDKNGDISHILVGTFSGHFRTGLEAQAHLVRHLVIALQTAYPHKSAEEISAMVVQREGQATNPRTIEVIGRGIGLDGAEAQREELALKAEAMRWHPLGTPEAGHAMTPLGKELKDSKSFAVAAITAGLFQTPSSRKPVRDAGPDAPRSAMDLLARLDDFAVRATQSNDPGDALVIPQLVGVLGALQTYVNTLSANTVDLGVKREVDRLAARWNVGVAGATGADLGLVFSQPPVGRKTRVVATVDPKATDEQLRDLVKAGADVARFNTAHGSMDEKIGVMKKLRRFAAELGREITIQVDLEGPKLRLRTFDNPKKQEFNDIWLKPGQTATLTTKNVLGSQEKMLFPVDYPTMCDDVQVGHKVSMNDGLVQLEVTGVDKKKGTVTCKVLTEGKVWDNKGVAFPQSTMSGRAVTDEDVENLTALLPHVDVFAQSFVQNADDVLFLRDRMEDLGTVVPIIAKIERGAVATNQQLLTEIALAADGLMVARGDLGTEMGEAEVPAAERLIREVGERTGRPVMLATEVMLSILKESRGSRGDVDALRTAIVDQKFQAIMLGKETSAHKQPGEVVRTVSNYIVAAEAEREKPKARDRVVLGPSTAMALRVGAPLMKPAKPTNVDPATRP